MVKTHKKKKCFSFFPKVFFKVFLPDQSSHHMKFPPAFIKYFSGNIPFKSKIIGHMKSSWQVDLLKVDDSLYFEEGWNQFVLDNCLDFGDFLVFSFDGNARFHVKIYGPNGCERKPMCHAEESCRDSSIRAENHIDEKREDLKGLDVATISKQFEEDDKNVKNASEIKSDLPFFRVVMKHSYVYRGSLNVPERFIKRHLSHMISIKQGITLVHMNKSWPITISGVGKFAAGWIRFAKDNALKVRDICVFQMVESKSCVFDVSIIKCSR